MHGDEAETVTASADLVVVVELEELCTVTVTDASGFVVTVVVGGVWVVEVLTTAGIGGEASLQSAHCGPRLQWPMRKLMKQIHINIIFILMV